MKKLASVVPIGRIWVVYIGLVALVILLLLRMGYLYLNEVDKYSEHGLKRSIKTVIVPASKGMIKDRNGEVLAVTTVLYSLIVDLNHLRIKANDSQKQINNANRRIDKFKSKISELAQIIGKKSSWILEKVFLQNPKRVQEYLAKDLQIDQVNQINALKMPGLIFERRLKRYYPYGEVTAHIIGFSDYANIGRSGVEQSYDKYLQGKSGKMWLRRDRMGAVTAYVAGDSEFKRGKDLSLTIDIEVQNLVFLALKKALIKSKAKRGGAVVLSAKTGDILALVGLPSYNTNNTEQRVGKHLSNVVAQELFEPGSVLKPFVVLAGLESQKISPSTTLYLGNKRPKHEIKIGKHIFKDSSSLDTDTIDIATMLKKSSNVGAIKLGTQLSDKNFTNVLNKVGFGQAVDIGLYGKNVKGVVPKKLSKIGRASLSIGYGINASLLQIVRAYSVLANNGKMVQPRLVKNDKEPEKQMFDDNNIKIINRWLLGVTERDGTAPKAQILGFKVAGKTGTTLMSDGKRGYKKDQYIALFVGFTPYEKPKIIVAILVEDPKGKYYCGEVAAPVFAEIAENTLNHLGVRSNKQRLLSDMLAELKL